MENIKQLVVGKDYTYTRKRIEKRKRNGDDTIRIKRVSVKKRRELDEGGNRYEEKSKGCLARFSTRTMLRYAHALSRERFPSPTDGPRALLKRSNNLDGLYTMRGAFSGRRRACRPSNKVGIKSARGGDETRGPAQRRGNGVSVVHQRSVVHVCYLICGPCPG